MQGLGLGPGFAMGMEIWGRQLTTWGVKLGSQKGVILVTKSEPKSKVSSMVYLHAGWEIRFAVLHAIHQEANGDSHEIGS